MKFLKAIIVLLCFCSFISNAHAKKFSAKVKKIRGKATKLLPGAFRASKISLHDKIPEDTSIVTDEKSFVRVVFSNGSQLNIGPKSKIRIQELESTGPGLVTLLKGQLRSKVDKDVDVNSKNKLLIKTRTAALGVRGTEFQAIYNPENRITSLLTFKGNVAMVKFDEEKEKAKVRKKLDVTRNNKEVELVETKIKVKKPSESAELEEVLKSKDVVHVKQGQYSGAVDQLEKASKPVKVNPVQLNALYKNKDFKTKTEKTIKAQTVSDVTTKQVKLTIKAAEQEAPAEGFFNKATGDHAPKSGGLIDMETGIYVPPANDSKLDKKQGSYIPDSVGKIDAETGEYVAPKGLKLDAKSGFVVDKKSKEDESKLVAMKEDMNSNISSDVILAKTGDEPVSYIADRIINNRELLAKDTLYVTVGRFMEEMDIETNDNGFHSFTARKSDSVAVGWDLQNNSFWQPTLKFQVSSIDYDKFNHQILSESEHVLELSFGVRFYLMNRLSLHSELTIDQRHFVTFKPETSPFNQELIRVAIPRAKVHLEWNAIQIKSVMLRTKLTLAGNAGKTSGSYRVKHGFGYGVELGAKYWVKPFIWLDLAVFRQDEEQSVENSEFRARLSRGSDGGKITLGTSF